MVDELPSELDRKNLKLILDWLLALEHQIFLTSVESSVWTTLYPDLCCQVFHVEHGEVIAIKKEKLNIDVIDKSLTM